MRAALYARFSTDKQSSTADQLRVCRAIALEQARPVPPEELQAIDREIGKLQQLVADGVLTRETVAPARQALQERRREVERRTRQPTIAEAVFDAEQAYREEATGMRAALQGDDVATGREVLREMFGEIRLEPASGEERPVLWAILDPRPVALEASAG